MLDTDRLVWLAFELSFLLELLTDGELLPEGLTLEPLPDAALLLVEGVRLLDAGRLPERAIIFEGSLLADGSLLLPMLDMLLTPETG